MSDGSASEQTTRTLTELEVLVSQPENLTFTALLPAVSSHRGADLLPGRFGDPVGVMAGILTARTDRSGNVYAQYPSPYGPQERRMDPIDAHVALIRSFARVYGMTADGRPDIINCKAVFAGISAIVQRFKLESLSPVPSRFVLSERFLEDLERHLTALHRIQDSEMAGHGDNTLASLAHESTDKSGKEPTAAVTQVRGETHPRTVSTRSGRSGHGWAWAGKFLGAWFRIIH